MSPTSFRPNPNDELIINGITYRIAEHPSAPGIPYGQEGRAGVVFQLLPSSPPKGVGGEGLPSPSGRGVVGEGKLALKVFKPRFRLPFLVSQADKLAPYAIITGLRACKRIVLTPSRYPELLHQHPELTYAVLMPWIEGPTWFDLQMDRKSLSAETSLSLARSLAQTLMQMEEQGIAHCDLSGPNVMLPLLAGGTGVELVDLESLYAPGMVRPQVISSGSAGYSHHQATNGLWGLETDRFAGAVLLVEMLGWCDPRVVQAAWGESYFDPAEMQLETFRYRTLVEVLNHRWGSNIASLFERAWRSNNLLDSPTFGEWLVALPESASGFQLSLANEQLLDGGEREDETATAPETTAEIRAFMQAAQRMEDKGNLEGALELYRQALELASADPALYSLRREIELTIQDLEIRVPLPSQPPTFDAKVGVSYQASQEPMSAAVIDLQQKNLNKWRLWFEWVLATTISVAIGYVLADYILRMIPIYLEGEPVIRAAYDVIVGTALGVAQWIILRSYFRTAGWWILGTSLGLCLNGFISGFVWDFLRIRGWMPGYWDVLSELVSRAPLGFLQWLFLRQYTRKSGAWIILTAVSWAIGWYLNGIWSYDKGWLLAGAVVGGTVGVITGGVLSMIAPFQLQGQK